MDFPAGGRKIVNETLAELIAKGASPGFLGGWYMDVGLGLFSTARHFSTGSVHFQSVSDASRMQRRVNQRAVDN